MILLILTVYYIIQLIAVFIALLIDEVNTQKELLINLIPFGWVYYLYKRYERLPWDE